DLGQAEAREVGEPELEDPWAQREATAVEVHVAELDERQQEAPRRRAREARPTGDLAQPELAVLAVERADDRQPAFQGLDVVGVARARGVGDVARRVLIANTTARRSRR